ncbi:MAG TPA: SRPBCC domain-containing protein [Haliangiales bacterium]|nr:SRPBCC domain-containing protein [Haliangiales bacterium]
MTRRKHETIVELRVDPETVWNAIAEAEGLKRWFALDARLDGGKVWVSWGPEMEGDLGVVREVEPPRRLVWANAREGVEMATEFILEGTKGRTTLRIVASGFDGAEWDDEYEATKNGWRLFGVQLRHALERHPGQPRAAHLVGGPVAAPRGEAWRRLLAALGDPPGPVVHRIDEAALAFVVPELGDGLVAIELAPAKGGTYVSATVGAFGADPPRQALAAWRDRLTYAMPT